MHAFRAALAVCHMWLTKNIATLRAVKSSPPSTALTHTKTNCHTQYAKLTPITDVWNTGRTWGHCYWWHNCLHEGVKQCVCVCVCMLPYVCGRVFPSLSFFKYPNHQHAVTRDLLGICTYECSEPSLAYMVIQHFTACVRLLSLTVWSKN